MKIAIVGTARNTVMEAPYKDDDWRIWSLGCNYDVIPRYSTWYELHTLKQLEYAEKKHFRHLEEAGESLVIMRPEPKLPKAKLFPREDVQNEFPYLTFTSSIAWMIGLAIHLKAEEIGVWGVNMSNEEEYLRQKACCESLLNIAQDRGIKVTIPEGSPLLKAGVYPDDKLVQDLSKRFKGAERDYQKYRDLMNQYDGMKQVLKDLRFFYG